MRACGNFIACIAVLGFAGCAKFDLVPLDPAHAGDASSVLANLGFSREREDRILALNAERVSEADVRNVLSGAPAPRIINIHGGIAPVQRRLTGFSKFLVGLGYPDRSLRLPGSNDYTISCYYDAELFAGIFAWFYERDGMRPMIIGHSQGGMQAIKTLQILDGQTARESRVWSPLTWKPEDRTVIRDPLTGKTRPVVGLSIPYIASLGAGGAARVLPNQWDMMMSLRTVPDAVDEFTGFYLAFDVLGGDYLGFGPSNHFKSSGRARVRNVELPMGYSHAHTPELTHLLGNRQAVEWIYSFSPRSQPEEPTGIGEVKGIVFGADVWKSVRKHWVLELQRLIRARRHS